MPQLSLNVVGTKVKIIKPAVMAFVTSAALAAASLGISFSEHLSNCLTFDAIACPESKQVNHLEKLKELGATGARAAILTTVAQYQADDDLIKDGIDEAYSYTEQSNSECLVSALQKYVKSGWIVSNDKELEDVVPIAQKSRTLAVASRHMTLGETKPSRSLTPVVNQLRHCVSSTSLSNTQAVHHQEACASNHNPMAEDAWCISDAIQGITKSEVYRLQKDDTSVFEAAPLPNTDIDLDDEATDDTDAARSSEPSAVATPTAKSSPSPTQTTPKPSPTLRPSKSPVSTPSEPAAPKPNYTPPPEYSENVRPIPTPYAPVEPYLSPDPLLENPERSIPPSEPIRESRKGTSTSQSPSASRAS